MATTTTSLRAIGITANLVLAGISFCSSSLAVPRLYDINVDDAVRAFRDFYQQGAILIVPSTMATFAVSLATGYFDPDYTLVWVPSAILTIGTLVWTNMFMKPVNTELVNMANSDTLRQGAGAAGVEKLLRKWVSLNYVRATLYLAAGVAGLSVLLRETHGQNLYL